MRIEGCLSAIPTQFNDTGIDEQALAAHATWMIDRGCSGIVVCGTTGEAATMSNDEKIRAMNIVSEAVGSRATVIGGAGNNSTSESLEFVERVCKETRVDAIMSVVPYYTKPPQEGIRQHFGAIADTSTLPMIVYNVPGRTVVSMSEETILTLLDHPNIVACKEASGDIHFAGKLIRQLDGRGTLLSGDDGTSAAFVAIGGHGVISVASNVAPRVVSDAVKAAREGDLKTLKERNDILVQLQDLLFQQPSPIAVKVALAHRGHGSERVRQPLCLMDEAAAEKLRNDIDALGLPE